LWTGIDGTGKNVGADPLADGTIEKIGLPLADWTVKKSLATAPSEGVKKTF
jgi:hypothetical protein